MLYVVSVIVLTFLALLVFGALNLGSSDASWLANLDTWANTLKSIMEALAIIVAGYWTYDHFIKSREKYPYPKIQHSIKHYGLGENIAYVSVFLKVTNEGKRILDLGGGVISVKKVLPLSLEVDDRIKTASDSDIRAGKVEKLFVAQNRRVDWVSLGERKWMNPDDKMKNLEPGQTREIQFDFLFEKGINVIEVLSTFENVNLYWELATLHSLN